MTFAASAQPELLEDDKAPSFIQARLGEIWDGLKTQLRPESSAVQDSPTEATSAQTLGRTRRLRKGTRRRLASNVALVCAALHALFVCTATGLGYVVEPYREFAADVAATFRPMVERPDLLEIFGGHASVTERASYHGLTALRPRGYIYGGPAGP